MLKNSEMNEEEVMENPLDLMISRLDGYIKDPKLITPETLDEFKTELIDLKESMNMEDDEDEYDDSSVDQKDKMPMKKPGLIITIGRVGKGAK